MNQQQEHLARQQANYCRVFSNSTRVQILWALEEDDEMSVGAIAGAIGASIQNVSQHLSLMKGCQVLTSRREGQTIYYRIDPDALKQQCAGLFPRK
jgi:DNA-binding transcriptional ArsR family regulator